MCIRDPKFHLRAKHETGGANHILPMVVSDHSLSLAVVTHGVGILLVAGHVYPAVYAYSDATRGISIKFRDFYISWFDITRSRNRNARWKIEILIDRGIGKCCIKFYSFEIWFIACRKKNLYVFFQFANNMLFTIMYENDIHYDIHIVKRECEHYYSGIFFNIYNI